MDHYKYVSEGTWQGRAEYFNGTHWGTICDDFFNLTFADVFCRSLNPRFSAVSWTNKRGLPYSRSNDFSDGYKKPILMDDISCSGKETYLN
jgi:deleted-in-malignant-brain-tumors protein 1